MTQVGSRSIKTLKKLKTLKVRQSYQRTVTKKRDFVLVQTGPVRGKLSLEMYADIFFKFVILKARNKSLISWNIIPHIPQVTEKEEILYKVSLREDL